MNESEGCHALVEHLHHEHDRLNQVLLKIGHEVAALSQPGRPGGLLAQLSQELAALRMELQAHFAEEETGGCLEEAVVRCPSLAGERKEVLAEHAVLDRMLDQLVAQTRNPAAASADVAKNYRAFAEKLQSHEAAETRMLQMAFGAEAADYDVESVD
jgi:hypothetical protein